MDRHVYARPMGAVRVLWPILDSADILCSSEEREPACERCRRDDGTTRRPTALRPTAAGRRCRPVDPCTAPRVATFGQIPAVGRAAVDAALEIDPQGVEADFPPAPPRCRAWAGRATRSGSVRARWQGGARMTAVRALRRLPLTADGGTSHAGGCNGPPPGPACREAAARAACRPG